MEPLHPPTVDDRAIWDLWLSQYRLPVVLVAEQLGLFRFLHQAPASLEAIRAELRLAPRSVDALVTALAATGFVRKHQELFHLTDTARTYLVEGQPFYWLPMLREVGGGQVAADALLQALQRDTLDAEARITRRWEQGQMTAEEARLSNRRMHSHSLPAAIGVAHNGDFGNVRRLLDVAGGSGCFSIALAQRYPELRCTVADLPPVTEATQAYIERYGCSGRVDTYAMNMFEDDWPSGYDAIFFSNVFHDWDARRREDLARRSFAALPPGGAVYLHEMLLDDAHDGPVPAALFSVVMLGTRGQQYTFLELDDLLRRAGFVDTQVTPTYGYYSLVRATRPAER